MDQGFSLGELSGLRPIRRVASSGDPNELLSSP